jgi:hypothetical protein
MTLPNFMLPVLLPNGPVVFLVWYPLAIWISKFHKIHLIRKKYSPCIAWPLMISKRKFINWILHCYKWRISPLPWLDPTVRKTRPLGFSLTRSPEQVVAFVEDLFGRRFFLFLCCDINSDILWYGNHIVFFLKKNIFSSDISVIISMICYYINSIVVIYCNIWEFICKIPYLTKHIMVVLLCNGILGDIWCMYFSLWLCEQNAFWNILRHLNDAMMI